MDVHPPKNGIFIGIDPYPYIPIFLSAVLISYGQVWSSACHKKGEYLPGSRSNQKNPLVEDGSNLF
jgi:hypothetical protein